MTAHKPSFDRRLFNIGIIFLAIAFSISHTSAQEDAQPPILQLSTDIQIFDLDLNPDSQLLAVAGDNGVTFFDTTLTELTIVLPEYTARVASVRWSPDGTMLATGGGLEDHTIRIWDFDATTLTFTERTTISVYADFVSVLKWSPDGTMLATLSVLGSALTNRPDITGNVQILDTNNWNGIGEPRFVTDPIRALGWSPDSTKVAVGGASIIYTFDANTADAEWRIGFLNATSPTYFAWSPSNEVAYSYNRLNVVNGTDGTSLYSFFPEFGVPSYILWNPLGDFIATDDIPNGFRIMDINTGTTLRTFTTNVVRAMDWSDDGDLIVTGTLNGEIAIWDASNLPSVEGTPTITPNPTTTPRPTPTPSN
ncbi:MAG: WD40 repeat domain-containing protein [Aggregatilineales bacterium]